MPAIDAFYTGGNEYSVSNNQDGSLEISGLEQKLVNI